jgi:hypothetical protein
MLSWLVFTIKRAEMRLKNLFLAFGNYAEMIIILGIKSYFLKFVRSLQPGISIMFSLATLV